MTIQPQVDSKGTCYKFQVASAEQAAAVIRERLGAKARVLSVRSIERTGLRRLWASPMLEVIAQVDSEETSASEPLGSDLGSAKSESLGIFSKAAPTRQTISHLLRRSGLSEMAIGRLEADPAWGGISSEPLHRALVSVSQLLRREGARHAEVTRISRAAFMGTPGAGRTTALCKWLGLEVFRRARMGHVVSVELDRPNPPGVLPVFCEALGVPLARFPASTVPEVAGGFVYFDLPGLSLKNHEQNRAMAAFLDREKIEHRILVLNAAYDHATLRAAYSIGRGMGATHLVFTHLDEVLQWGRLWDYLGDGRLQPLFWGTGPSLTGDCEDDVWDSLVRRTLAGAEVGSETAAPQQLSEENEEVISS